MSVHVPCKSSIQFNTDMFIIIARGRSRQGDNYDVQLELIKNHFVSFSEMLSSLFTRQGC